MYIYIYIILYHYNII